MSAASAFWTSPLVTDFAHGASPIAGQQFSQTYPESASSGQNYTHDLNEFVPAGRAGRTAAWGGEANKRLSAQSTIGPGRGVTLDKQDAIVAGGSGAGLFQDSEASHHVGIHADAAARLRLLGDDDGFDDGSDSALESGQAGAYSQRGHEAEDPSPVILAVATARNRLGIAIYYAESESVECAETFESPTFDMLRLIVAQIQPHAIIAHNVNGNAFMDAICDSDECKGGAERVKFLRMADFSADAAHSKFRMVALTGANSDIRTAIPGADSADNTQLVRALGGLFAFLLKNLPPAVDGESDKLHLTSLQLFNIDSTMQLDANTIHALQVFKTEEHPSVLSRGGPKEGLSLFCILSRWSSSPPGRHLLRQWLMRPLLNAGLIEERYDAVDFLLDADRSSEGTLDEIRGTLRTFRDVEKIIARIRNCRASIIDWKNLFAATMNARRLAEVLRRCSENVTAGFLASESNTPASGVGLQQYELPLLLARIGQSCANPTISDVAALIDSVLDLKESTKLRRLCIKSGVSDDLDDLKHTYDGLGDFLTLVAKEEMCDLESAYARDLHVVYMPQVGSLVALSLANVMKRATLPREDLDSVSPFARTTPATLTPFANLETPLFEDFETNAESNLATQTVPAPTAVMVQVAVQRIPGFEYQFHTSTKIYCKTPRMRELDETIGDIANDIVDMEATLAREVSDGILETTDELSKLSAAQAQLDAFVALACTASENNYVRPRIIDSQPLDPADRQVLYIENGRHPLQELCLASSSDGSAPEFIPNSTAIANSREGAVQLITGPNFSGKSVYLKQVGLIVLMAHIGSFVPATSAEIALTDRICTRIHSRESVAVAQSTFMIDCVQLNDALKHCTRRSLVLADEFGKGTSVEDGVALFAATIAYLLRRSENCPKAIFTTHFLEAISLLRTSLEEGELHSEGPAAQDNLQLRSMECMDDEDAGLVFLYKLSPGVASASYGTLCAKRSGISESIIRRANELAETFALGELVEAIDLHPETTQARNEHTLKVLSELAKLDCTNEQEISNFLDVVFEQTSLTNVDEQGKRSIAVTNTGTDVPQPKRFRKDESPVSPVDKPVEQGPEAAEEPSN